MVQASLAPTPVSLLVGQSISHAHNAVPGFFSTFSKPSVPDGSPDGMFLRLCSLKISRPVFVLRFLTEKYDIRNVASDDMLFPPRFYFDYLLPSGLLLSLPARE